LSFFPQRSQGDITDATGFSSPFCSAGLSPRKSSVNPIFPSGQCPTFVPGVNGSGSVALPVLVSNSQQLPILTG
jgi:hypothetical protein